MGKFLTFLHLRTKTTFVHFYIDYSTFSDCFVIRNHILVQFYITKLWIPKIQIGLTVIVYKYRRVNVVPISLIHKWLAKSIRKWSRRTVTDADTNYHTTILFVNRYIEIKFTVSFYTLRCPGAGIFLINPCKIIFGQDGTVVGPVHHVFGRIAFPVIHCVKIADQHIFIMCGIQVHRVTGNHWCRICRVNILHNGIICFRWNVK